MKLVSFHVEADVTNDDMDDDDNWGEDGGVDIEYVGELNEAVVKRAIQAAAQAAAQVIQEAGVEAVDVTYLS